MLQGKLARALSGEDHSFIGGRSNLTNSKTAARDKALLLEINLWFKVVKPYSETKTGSNKPNREQATTQQLCDIYGKAVATCAAPKTGDKPVSKSIKENNSESAEDGKFDAANVSDGNDDHLSESEEDDSKIFAKPGVAEITSCNYFGINCFSGVDYAGKLRIFCGNCWADHDGNHPAKKDLMTRAEEIANKYSSTSELELLKGELIEVAC